MKIVTWNINSIRLRMPLLKSFCEEHQPDVIAIQETKVQDLAFPLGSTGKTGSLPFSARACHCFRLPYNHPMLVKKSFHTFLVTVSAICSAVITPFLSSGLTERSRGLTTSGCFATGTASMGLPAIWRSACLLLSA